MPKNLTNHNSANMINFFFNRELTHVSGETKLQTLEKKQKVEKLKIFFWIVENWQISTFRTLSQESGLKQFYFEISQSNKLWRHVLVFIHI